MGSNSQNDSPFPTKTVGHSDAFRQPASPPSKKERMKTLSQLPRRKLTITETKPTDANKDNPGESPLAEKNVEAPKQPEPIPSPPDLRSALATPAKSAPEGEPVEPEEPTEATEVASGRETAPSVVVDFYLEGIGKIRSFYDSARLCLGEENWDTYLLVLGCKKNRSTSLYMPLASVNLMEAAMSLVIGPDCENPHRIRRAVRLPFKSKPEQWGGEELYFFLCTDIEPE